MHILCGLFRPFVWPWHSRSHLGGLLPISSCKKELPPAPSEISIFPRERTGQQFSPSTYPLGSLPPELIMLAFGYLIVVSRVYTNKAPDQSRLSRREKWLIIHPRKASVCSPTPYNWRMGYDRSCNNLIYTMRFMLTIYEIQENPI